MWADLEDRNQVVEHLAQIERIAQHVDAGVPFQVLEYVSSVLNYLCIVGSSFNAETSTRLEIHTT